MWTQYIALCSCNINCTIVYLIELLSPRLITNCAGKYYILHITLISIPTINFIITFFLFTKVAPSTPNDVTQNWGIKI